MVSRPSGAIRHTETDPFTKMEECVARVALAHDELVLPVVAVGDGRCYGRGLVVGKVAKERNASNGRDVDHIEYGVCISVARALLSATY